MKLNVAIQMDPLQRLEIAVDSSLFLARAGLGRGYNIWHYQPDTLALEDGELYATARRLDFDVNEMPIVSNPERLSLRDMDVVLMRQDPPFDMAYITATYLLEHIQPDVLVLNDPAGVRNAPEKLLPTYFPDLIPPTLITRDIAAITEFRRKHGDIVIKPLYGAGGAGVFHVAPGDENFTSEVDLLGRHYSDALAVQRYVPEIRQGDKRILLIEGEPVGTVLRVPNEGEARANLHAGGHANRTGLTDRDRKICQRLGPTLREMGALLTGIDVIGSYLIEINITSPGMVADLYLIEGTDISGLFWDAVERRVSAEG